MKDKRIIIILVILISLVLILNGFLVYLAHQKTTGNSNKNRNYFCSNSKSTEIMEEINAKYDIQETWQFKVTSEQKVEDGILSTIYTFDSKEDYDYFIEHYETNVYEIREKVEYNLEDYKIRHYVENTIVKNSDDELIFTEAYLSWLKDSDFICEEE